MVLSTTRPFLFRSTIKMLILLEFGETIFFTFVIVNSLLNEKKSFFVEIREKTNKVVEGIRTIESVVNFVTLP